MEKRLFTSECVTNGHPDKVADSISDAILDACLEQDPGSRVACETMVTTNFCIICGEITTKAKVDYAQVARDTIRKIGYKNVLISTDGGQVENPHWELAEEEYLQYMLDHGIPEEHIRYMSHDLPSYLLGIEA